MAEPTVITTVKKIDAASAPVLGEALNQALDSGVKELVVDMGETTYISSIGLRVFLAAQKRVRSVGGSMVLIHVSPQVMEVFDITGFSGILTIGD